MTLAAAKKLILKLPLNKRLDFAAKIWNSVPALPVSVGIKELERRIDEVESGKVKPISWDKFQRDLDKMRKSIKGARASAVPRRARKTPRSKARRSA
jgi:putative addiction module component (TIGR02574 family)